MIWPEPMASAPGLIRAHAALALGALGLGVVVLARRKGTAAHRRTGRVWVALMFAAALTAVFIHEGDGVRLLGLGPFGPIHLLVVLTVAGLAQGLWHIRRGDVAAHAAAMRTTFLLSLVVAGAFTLLPGRRMALMLFGEREGPALAALAALLAGAAALGWRWRARPAPQPPTP